MAEETACTARGRAAKKWLLGPLIVVFALVTHPIETVRAARRAWQETRGQGRHG